MRRRTYRILEGIGVSLFLFGWAIVPAWLILALIGGSNLSSVEFPLGDPDGAFVDSRGRIYVGDGFYFRVQRYSPDGAFERGWFVPGIIALRVSNADQVEVATRSANRVQTYDTEGRLLRDFRREDIYSYVDSWRTDGSYLVKGGLLPRVVDAATGKTVIDTGWRKRLIAAPFPAFAYAAVGFAIGATAHWRRRRGGAR